MIPTLISAMIATPFYDWFYGLQISKLSNENTLLFIHDHISSWIIFFLPGIIVFLILLIIRKTIYTKAKKVMISLFIVTIILIMSTFVLLINFFNYTDISKEGLC